MDPQDESEVRLILDYLRRKGDEKLPNAFGYDLSRERTIGAMYARMLLKAIEAGEHHR